MMAWLGRITSWLVVGALLAGGWWWLQMASHKKPQESGTRTLAAVAVTTHPVLEQTVERRVGVVGTLQGFEEVILTPKVEGRVRTILHDINASLAPGTPILILDDVDHKLAESEAHRAVELELARVGLAADKLPARGKEEEDVIATLPTVLRARNLEENAQRRLQRSIKLGNVATGEELDQAKTDLRVATANYQQQLIECRSVLAAAREKLAKLETAQQRLRDTTLRVPVPSPERLAEIAQARGVARVEPEGVRYVVAQRMVSEGELVRATSSGVFKLVLDQPLKLVVQVPERYLGEVRIGQRVMLGVEAYERERFTGSVVRVNPTVDRASRSFMVEVSMPNEDHRLRAGMFARASILTRQNDTARVVPEDAVVSFAGVDKIFVVRNGKAAEVPVRIGERLETNGGERRYGWLEITGSVNPGEPVVTSGQTQLADGTPVRIHEAVKPE